jgi:lipopolysaccharide export system permease protein
LPTTDENYFKNMREVMSVSQIMVQLDSNKLNMRKIILDAKNQMAPLLSYVRDDTAKHRTPLPSISTQTHSFWQQIPDSLQSGVLSQAEISARSMKSILEVNVQNLSLQQMNFTDSKIELNKRFALPFACILLFLIGAALGSIIRKGGLGMPFISAVLFFILYYFMNTIGEKIAKENVVSVEIGIWAPSFILTLIAAFLLYKANNDSPLFNKETYIRFGERIKSIFTKSTSSPSVS